MPRSRSTTSTRDDVESAPGRGHVIQSVARGYQVFSALGAAGHAKQLGELSAETGLHKTTALRFLRTFIAEGLLVQDPETRRYMQNPAFWIRLTSLARPAMSLVQTVQGSLTRLAQRTEGTAILLLADEARRHGILAMQALPGVRVALDPTIHPVTPLHATGAGKCYLAYADPEQLSAYLTLGLTKLTGRTIASPSRLAAELARVRRQGYALNRGETDAAVSAFSVPLHDSSGVVGGLSVGYAARPILQSDLESYLPSLRRTADAISGVLTNEWWAAREQEFADQALTPPAQVESDDPSFGEGALPVVRSLARAIRVLELLARSPEGRSVAEVMAIRRLDRATTFRLLLTLRTLGMVSRDSVDGRHRINPVLWIRYANILLSTVSLTKGTAAILEWLTAATGATAIFACPDVADRRSTAVQYALPNRPVYFHPSDDVPPPLHAVASGKCYMAAQSKRWLMSYMEDGVEPLTGRTIDSPQWLLAELDVVRKQGYALNREESIAGAGGLSVPVVDGTGKVVGGLSLALLATELTDSNVRQWLPMLRRGADALSRLLVSHWREFHARTARKS